MITFDRALIFHRVLMRIGLSAIVFAWLFVFANEALLSRSASDALVQVALLYALAQTTCALVVPIAMREIGFGMRRGIVLGALVVCLAFIVLAGASVGMFIGGLGASMTVFAVLIGLYSALYKIPYATGASVARVNSSRMAVEMLLALMPALWVLAGMLDADYAFVIIFSSAAILIMVGIVPLLFVGIDVYERFSWGYRETYAQLFIHDNRDLIRKSIVRGVDDVALLFFWPLATFLFLGWSYVVVGVVLASSLVGVFLVRYLLEKMRVDSRLVRDTVVASGWLARILAVTPYGFVVADVYARSVVPYNHDTHLADAGHYIDEYTALKEIASAIGRIGVTLFAAILFASLSFDIAFVILFAVVGLIAIGSTFGGHHESLRKV